jgi:hypothetical protein
MSRTATLLCDECGWKGRGFDAKARKTVTGSGVGPIGRRVRAPPLSVSFTRLR